MNTLHVKLKSLSISSPVLASLIANSFVELQSGDVVRSSCGQILAHCVDSFSDFDSTISKERAELMIEDHPTVMSYTPNLTESDVDAKRYRGYATRYAVLPSGEVNFQMLVKSFGSAFWINLPEGVAIKTISLAS